MANKYLDETGLAHFWGDVKTYFTGTATPKEDGTAAVGTSSKFAREDHVHPSDMTKVDKVSGKGLSTNDFTTTLKNKLDGIASGAEVNVQSDWNVTDTASDAFIKNKPTIPAAVTVDTALSNSSTNPVQNKVINTALGNKANTASPTLTGTPKAPTAATGTNTTQIATTEFVTTAISNAQVGAASFQGTVSNNTTISDSSYKKGWYWVVAQAGTYVGEACEVGDMIFAIADKGTSYSAANFSVLQNNLDLVAITNTEIDAIVV